MEVQHGRTGHIRHAETHGYPEGLFSIGPDAQGVILSYGFVVRAYVIGALLLLKGYGYDHIPPAFSDINRLVCLPEEVLSVKTGTEIKKVEKLVVGLLHRSLVLFGIHDD